MPERKIALLLRIRRGLKDELTSLSKREHRSLNQQIEFLLEKSLLELHNNAGQKTRGRELPHEEERS